MAGQAVAFLDSAGNKYVFIQGGASGSGLDNDFIAQVKASGSGFGTNTLTLASNSGIIVNIV